MWDTLITHTVGRTPHKLPTSFNHDNKCLDDKLEIAANFNTFFTSIGQQLQQKIKDSPDVSHPFVG